MDAIAPRLKQAFDAIFPAPLLAWEQFASHGSLQSFPRHHILKAAGAAEHAGYFLLEGAVGTFLWREQHEVCIDLYFENIFFADYVSLITTEATPLENIVLEPSLCLVISKEAIAALKETPMGMRLFLYGAESSFVEKQQQQIDLLTKTAEQRYAELLRKSPEIVQRLPQKHIASYLGVTPQSLSRIRRGVQ